MEAYAPYLRLVVANRMKRDGAPVELELRFRSVSDFEPEGVSAGIKHPQYCRFCR